MKIVVEIDTNSVSETVVAKGLIVKVVVVDRIDWIDKYRGITLL